LTAFAVIATAACLAAVVFTQPAHRSLRGIVGLLGLLLLIQVLLGIEAWLVRFGPGSSLPELERVSVAQAVIRTAHVVLGAFILATSVVLVLRAHRPAPAAVAGPASSSAPESIGFFPPAHGLRAAHQLEGTA
jgi:uncharacterized iron-regulated membrane protein